MEQKHSVAVLGLGIMGAAMASRLLSNGFAVTVFNRSAGKAEPLVKLGAKPAPTARKAAEGASVVLSMVSEDSAARAMWLGTDGALAGAKPGTVLIESSTVSVDWIHELAAAAQKAGCDLLDAPVTGSKPQAMAGELVFLVGGKEEALTRVQPVLAAMSKGANHLGPTGSGALMKLINNFICGVEAVAFAEALAMIERSTLDRETAVNMLLNGTPGSPILKAIAPRMLSKSYEPNFILNLLTKDMRYAQKQSGGMEICAVAIREFERAIEAGLGEKDFSAVIELYRNKN